jgi:hypothetical protein
MTLFPRAILAIVGIFVYSPPAIIRHWIDVYVKPIRFRVGEISLGRWKQEDLGMMEDEEDIMVNAEEELDPLGEYIPLKPGPRKHILADYGSTR